MSIATVIIPTKNRKTDLLRAIASCLKQSCDLEVLVLDDGSEDGTCDAVAQEFPSVRIYAGKECRRQMYRRNQGAEMATTEFLVFIDDDCEFPTNGIIEENIKLFDDPRVGAVGMPLINPKNENNIYQLSPEKDLVYVVSDALEGAVIFRKEVYEKLGGYNTLYVREGEGADLGIRLLSAGYYIRAGLSDPILHHHSPVRDNQLSHIYGPRNLILFAFLNVPLTYLFLQLGASTVKAIYHGFKIRHPLLKIYGLFVGYVMCFSSFKNRRPVSRETYKVYRRIKSKGLLPLETT